MPFRDLEHLSDEMSSQASIFTENSYSYKKSNTQQEPKEEPKCGTSFWSALLALSPISSFEQQTESTGLPESTAVLIDPGVESSFTPLHLAVMSGAPPDVIETLLDANAQCLSMKTDRGRTALACAKCLILEQQQQGGSTSSPKDKIHEMETTTIDNNNNNKASNIYFQNIDNDPIQNVKAAMEIIKTFQRNQKKSMHLAQAAKITSQSIADLTTIQKEFDPEKAWKKLNHVIKFTQTLNKVSQSSLGPVTELDCAKVVKPKDYKLPTNLCHLCVDIDIPVGFRRLRWAMLSSKSDFLTVQVMEKKLGFSQ
jgi:hypothetical protein